MRQGKGPCEACGSSDGCHTYEDHTHCYVCGKQEWFNGGGATRAPKVTRLEMTGFIDKIGDRKISKATCSKFQVTQEQHNGKTTKHYYPYFNVDTGEQVASKIRVCETKDFPWTGNREGIGLFGQQLCSGRGKYLTITEGELDAMAVSEMFDNKWDVVSIPDGARSAVKPLKKQLEWIEGYDHIVLAFDNDAEGQKAVDAVKDLFSPGKLKIMKFPDGIKDAGAMLEMGKIAKFTKAWWDAKVYRPDGIVAGQDTWELLTEKRKVRSTPYPWEGLNTLTRGHRPFELVTITSGSGMGKSQMIRELEHDILKRCTENIGVLALEEDVPRTTLGIMSVAASRPLHLEEDTPVDELRPYWEETLGTGRYFLFDHFGSTSADNLLARVRYMAKALDCKYIILDHLSIVVSSQDSGDERKAIDEIMTKLRTLVAETGVCLFLVSHLKRSGGVAHEDGGRISLSELRGSQSIAQLSDIVIGMERDQQHEDETIRNTTVVRVLKNRYTGETGPACYLLYDKVTGRMVETEKPLAEEDLPSEF